MNLLVLAWALSSTLALIFSCYSASDSRSDLKSLGNIGNGRRLIAVGDLRREVLRIITFAAYSAIGWLVYFDLLHGSAVVVVLVLGNIILMSNAFLDLHGRNALKASRHAVEETDNQREDRIAGDALREQERVDDLDQELTDGR